MSQNTEENKNQNEVPADIKEKLDKQEETINNLVSELKELRSKKQEAEAAAQELLKDKPSDTVDISAALDAELAKREKQQAEIARQTAEQEFRNSISEFSPDNDPGDLKYNAFKKEMEKFNFDGLKTREEFQKRFKEVYDFANRSNTKQPSKLNVLAGTSQAGGYISGDNNNSNLSKVEMDLINAKGWSTEKYMKLKEKQPAFIQQLLRPLI